jgi:hypothetical protein
MIWGVVWLAGFDQRKWISTRDQASASIARDVVPGPLNEHQ